MTVYEFCKDKRNIAVNVQCCLKLHEVPTDIKGQRYDKTKS